MPSALSSFILQHWGHTAIVSGVVKGGLHRACGGISFERRWGDSHLEPPIQLVDREGCEDFGASMDDGTRVTQTWVRVRVRSRGTVGEGEGIGIGMGLGAGVGIGTDLCHSRRDALDPVADT